MAGDGGVEGSRTPDLLNAIQALSQLSYDPNRLHMMAQDRLFVKKSCPTSCIKLGHGYERTAMNSEKPLLLPPSFPRKNVTPAHAGAGIQSPADNVRVRQTECPN